MTGFNSPVLGGGGTLIRNAEHSPNYVPGVSGWSINKDGSVEFNNGTFRGTVSGGTFQGTDFVVNSSGEFFYSGTPGPGTLVLSITQFAGSNDGFGNSYLAGYTSYDRNASSFVNVEGGIITMGNLVGGSPDTAHAATIQGNGAGLDLISPTSASATNAVQTFTVAGTPGASLSSANVAQSQQLTLSGATSPLLDIIVGARVSGSVNGLGAVVADTWHAPAGVANWTLSTCQYRRTAHDQIEWSGSITYSGPNVTLAGGSGAINTTAINYLPKAIRNVPVAHYTSTGVQKNTNATLTVDITGNMSLRWGDGVAGSAHDVNGLATGDVFWLDGVFMALGNVA